MTLWAKINVAYGSAERVPGPLIVQLDIARESGVRREPLIGKRLINSDDSGSRGFEIDSGQRKPGTVAQPQYRRYGQRRGHQIVGDVKVGFHAGVCHPETAQE
jgi:hypothetical protein